MESGDDVVSKLAEIGINPGDVSHVVQSHLHYDRAGGLEFFPHAAAYVGKRELDFARNPPVYQREYTQADFEHRSEWTEVETTLDLFSDGSIVIFSTPGHTRGHQSMLVNGLERARILVSDAHYSPPKMAARRLPGLLWSPDAMVESWYRIEEMQRQHDAELIFTHDLDWETTVRVAPDQWYE
jgi:glyoxylase-like metal-dependent hydrolase (beta-lactamase superfamily II)